MILIVEIIVQIIENLNKVTEKSINVFNAFPFIIVRNSYHNNQNTQMLDYKFI
jgi:hypothetical protein